MRSLNEACRLKCAVAFEIAIKNSIRREGKKAKLHLSKQDSGELYDFYLTHCEGGSQEALNVIGAASRKAAGKGPTFSVLLFSAMLAFVLATIFRSAWAPFAGLLICALVFYLLWARRRAAQKLWAARRTFKRGTEEALEKMCQVLCMTPFKFVNLAAVGGVIGAVIVCVYQTIIRL